MEIIGKTGIQALAVNMDGNKFLVGGDFGAALKAYLQAASIDLTDPKITNNAQSVQAVLETARGEGIIEQRGTFDELIRLDGKGSADLYTFLNGGPSYVVVSTETGPIVERFEKVKDQYLPPIVPSKKTDK